MKNAKQKKCGRLEIREQMRLSESKICIVGVGGLGCVVSQLLVRAGVGSIILIDFDAIERENLHRQILFDENDIGKKKVDTAVLNLRKMNSSAEIWGYNEKLSEDNVHLLDSDLVIDCTDNFETRFLINKYCVENKIPWIFGAVSGVNGFVFNVVNGACFNCIFRHVNKSIGCEGVLNSAVAIIGSIQTNEAVKILSGKEICRDLIHIDCWNETIEKIKVSKNKNCEVCK